MHKYEPLNGRWTQTGAGANASSPQEIKPCGVRVFVDGVQVGVLLTARQHELILPGAEKGRPVG